MFIPFYTHLESIEFLLTPTPLVQDSGKTRRKAATALSGTQHGEELSWKADLMSFFDTLPDTNSKFAPENTLKLL